MKQLLVFGILSFIVITTSAYSKNFNNKVVMENVFRVINQVIPDSHPEFLPKSPKEINIIRFERNGIIDFGYQKII